MRWDWAEKVLTGAWSGLIRITMSKPTPTHTTQPARHHINVLGQLLKLIPRSIIGAADRRYVVLTEIWEMGKWGQEMGAVCKKSTEGLRRSQTVPACD